MISLLVVNYRSAALALEAIRSAREASRAPLQVVVVDNSCDSHEAEVLRSMADSLVVSPGNVGYAAAINAGRRVCEGSAIVVSNPDVVFAAESVDRLVAELDRSSAAGPALFWDSGFEWHLPPGDLLTGREKIDEVLASRSRAWREQRDRRRRLHRIAFWSLSRTTEARMLSGAVMAIRARDFDELGGFDERFPLYFEENDFLRRLSSLRRKIAFVPEARCWHIYNQSAGQNADEAAARYAASEMKYLEKWNGPFAARLLKRLERPLPAVDSRRADVPVALPDHDVVVEVSPLATFATAAGRFARSGSLSVPEEIRSSVRGPLYLRVVDRRTGIVLETDRISA